MSEFTDDQLSRWSAFLPEVTETAGLVGMLEAVNHTSLASGAPTTPVGAPHRTQSMTTEGLPELDAPFYPLTAWLAADAVAEVHSLCDQHSHVVGGNTRESLVRDILRRAHDLGMRTWILELHEFNASLPEHLQNSRAGYDRFVQGINEQYCQHITRRYPALVGRAQRILGARVAFFGRLLDDVIIDREAVAHVRHVPGPAVLTDVDVGAGDVHDHGASVAILTFSDGTGAVYKPRPTDAEAGVSAITRELGARAGIDLSPIRIATCGDHGWVERVTPSPSTFERHYRGLGALLAIAYILRITDLHRENVVSTARGPLLLDTETCCDVAFPWHQEQAPDDQLVRESVLATQILPTGMGTDEARENVGAIAAVDPTLPRPRSFRLVNAFRSDMHLVFEPTPVPATGNRTTAHNLTPDTLPDAIALLEEGFRAVSGVITAHRSWARRLVETHLGGVRIRLLNRDTRFYGRLLSMRNHPRVSADWQDEVALFHRCAVGTSAPPEIVRAEIDQLWSGDVPAFYAHTDTMLLSDAHGRDLGSHLHRRPIDRVTDRIAGFDEREVHTQLALARLSLTNLFPTHGASLGLWSQAPPAHRPITRALKSTAHALVDDLLLRERPSGTPHRWLGARVSADATPWRLGIMDPWMYAGQCGIAQSLQVAGEVLERQDALDAAQRFVDTRLEDLESLTTSDLAASGQGVWAGPIGVGALAVRSGRLADGWNLLRRAVAAGAVSPSSDLLHGWSGVLSVLISLDDVRADLDGYDRIRREALAQVCADLTDPASAVAERTGYAHGVAGAWAQLGAENDPDPKAGSVVGSTLETLSLGRQQGWSTSRSHLGSGSAWCHGAPGILLALTQRAAVGQSPDPQMWDQAWNATLARGLTGGVELCHGALGSLMILRRAAHAELSITASTTVDALWERFADHALPLAIDGRRSRVQAHDSAMLGRGGILQAVCTELSHRRGQHLPRTTALWMW